MAEVLTDNRNRAAGEIRHAYQKGNGNLGAQGCVSYLFNKRGLFSSTLQTKMEWSWSPWTGAEDYTMEEDGIEVLCEPDEFEGVVKALEEASFEVASADLLLIPDTRVSVRGKDAAAVLRLIDLLDDCDDVQKVHHNAEFDEEELANL